MYHIWHARLIRYIFCFSLTVLQLADILEADDFWEDDPVDTVYITPPQVNDFSDEDSGEEDAAGMVDNLSKKQLEAEAEAVTVSGRRIESENIDPETDNSDDEDYLPLSNFVKKKPMKQDLRWIKNRDIHETNTVFPEQNYSNYRNMNAIELLELFLDDEVINFLVDESNKYALFINSPDPHITLDEMRCFLGILVNSGYNSVPSRRSFWDSGEDLKNQMVYKAMRRDRFESIMRFLHCSDNTKLDKADKMTKLRPFINLLKSRFIHHFVPEREIDYDESMVEYFGKHGCKQYIRGKPIRFGYKVWCINTKAGYLINFEVYQGAIPNSNIDHQKLYGKATAPLIEMVRSFPDQIRHLPFRFYFDNLFTSINLLLYLKENGFGGTGTVRENRLPKNICLESVKNMKKANRGTYDYSFEEKNSLIITRWKDNSVVTVASNVHGVFPITTANRYSAAEKKKVGISRPNVISKYNNFMGGTDQMDSNVNVYRIGFRGKKWWWSIFTWLIDVCIQNAWVLCRKTGGTTTQLQFRRQIVQCYLTKYQVLPKSAGRSSVAGVNSRVHDFIRFDRADHFIEYVPNSKRRRCAGNSHTDKASAVRTQCKKCAVGLCITCFVEFHRKT